MIASFVRFGTGKLMETWSDAPQILLSFTDALDSFNWTQVRALSAELAARIDSAEKLFPEAIAKQILSSLRRKRQFPSMERIADSLIRSGLDTAQIYRQYAQAMIDGGNFTAAALVLNSIVSGSNAPAEEKAEASGLLGRIDKQVYVNTFQSSGVRRPANLTRSIEKYYEVYRTDPARFYWHGINVVALLDRALNDSVEITIPATKSEIVSQLANYLAKDDLNIWERATAIENSVAAGDTLKAIEHAYFFVSAPGVDAFEIASLLRQLTDVWRLQSSQEPGTTLLPLLQAALLKREGGKLEVKASDITAAAHQVSEAQHGFEKVFGQDRYQPLEWLRTALTRCSAVARVESTTGQKIGTGFLVKAKDFFPAWDQQLLLLTNSHVISPADNLYDEAIPPNAAMAVFEENGRKFPVDQLVWSSPPGSLDASFVTLTGLDSGLQTCPLTPAPAPFDKSKPKRLYVIGYPLGGGLSFSLQDSAWLDADQKVLHYRTPTEPGSSGSPVFDQDYWTVIGLHHRGKKDMPRLNGESGTYEANEAISIAAIQIETRAADVKPPAS